MNSDLAQQRSTPERAVAPTGTARLAARQFMRWVGFYAHGLTRFASRWWWELDALPIALAYVVLAGAMVAPFALGFGIVLLALGACALLVLILTARRATPAAGLP